MKDFDIDQAAAAMNGLVAAMGAPPLVELEQAYDRLILEIAEFDQIETMSLVAAIATYPQFHANTIRIELLQHFVHRHATGRQKPTRNRIYQWLNRSLLNGWAAQMEDPVEDVFISNVVNNIGNNRIFEGIWEANDFSLQESLNALRFFRRDSWACEAFDQITSLLILSENLAQRCQLDRYCMGGGNVRSRMNLPPQGKLVERARFTRFTIEEIYQMGVDPIHLGPFIHDDIPAEGRMGDTTLEHRPLVRRGGEILVALPSAISPAIRRHIVISAIQADAVDDYDKILCRNQLEKVFNEGVQSLGGELIDFPDMPLLPEGVPAIVQQLVEFDRGKYAHIVFFKDPVADIIKTGIIGILDPSEKDADLIADHCQRCAVKVSERSGYRGGLTMAIHGGIGRGFIFSSGELPSRWHLSGFHLHDFITLGRARRMDFLSLWKLLDWEEQLSQRGIRIFNANGELNLLGCWLKNGERLVPREMKSGHISIQLATDFLAEVRRDLRKTLDIHVILRDNPGKWITVNRYHNDPLFKELEDDSIYIDRNTNGKGGLRGVIETPNRGWWVSVFDREPVDWHSDLQYRIWYALISWMARIAPLVESIIPDLPEGPIEFSINIDNLNQWVSQRIEDLPRCQDVIIRVVSESAKIKLTLPLGFLHKFINPVNLAEREIIRACLFGVFSICGMSVDEEILENLVQKVVRNERARFFHLVAAQNHRQQIPVKSRPKVRFVKESEINFASIGLAQRVLGRVDKNIISGSKECNTFLHAIVDDCWENIRVTLIDYNCKSLIVRALKNVEAVEFDKESWKLTAGALLAVHSDRENVIRSARRREYDRSHAEIVSRVLVEMAICTCSNDQSNAICESDFDRLMALVALLIHAANNCDAIRYGLTPPVITLHPNGEFGVDENYSETIIVPYVAQHFSTQFDAAADSYKNYFRNEKAEQKSHDEFPSAFVVAFSAEFGMSPQSLILAQYEIAKEAAQDESEVVQRTKNQLRSVVESIGLGPEIVNNLLKYFSLWSRGDWNQTPAGFTPKDWYPWRFRRRLSLLARPFIILSEEDDGQVIFSPAFLRDAFELLLTRLLEGRLPAEDFRSEKMKSWIGSATRRHGEEFEEAVASELARGGFQTKVARPMTEFGADESYGDIDVLAWIPGRGTFFVIECKRLRFARTIAEIGEQLREFKGGENDRLARHVRRCDWLSAHKDGLMRVARTDVSNPRLIPLLVTSTVVPMQYTSELPLASWQIIPLNDLLERINRI